MMQWEVVFLTANETARKYRIRNHVSRSHVGYDGVQPKAEHNVKSKGDPAQWMIQEVRGRKGLYTCVDLSFSTG